MEKQVEKPKNEDRLKYVQHSHELSAVYRSNFTRAQPIPCRFALEHPSFAQCRNKCVPARLEDPPTNYLKTNECEQPLE